MPRKPKLGKGTRFKRLVKKLRAKGARSPKALAVWIGQRKYGKKRMAKWSAQGRKRK